MGGWGREKMSLWAASRRNAALERVWAPSASRPELAAFQGTFIAGNYATVGCPGCRRCDQGSPFNGSGCNYALGRTDGTGLAAEIVGNAAATRGSDVLLLFGQDFTSANAVIEGGVEEGAYNAWRLRRRSAS